MTRVLTTTEDTPTEPPPAPPLRLAHSTFRAAMAALAAAGYAYDTTVRLWLAPEGLELHPASIERRTYDTPEDARLGRRSARPYVIVVHEPPTEPDPQEPVASELSAPEQPIPSETEA